LTSYLHLSHVFTLPNVIIKTYQKLLDLPMQEMIELKMDLQDTRSFKENALFNLIKENHIFLNSLSLIVRPYLPFTIFLKDLCLSIYVYLLKITSSWLSLVSDQEILCQFKTCIYQYNDVGVELGYVIFKVYLFYLLMFSKALYSLVFHRNKYSIASSLFNTLSYTQIHL